MFDDENSISEEEITAWLQASLGEVVTPKMEETLEKSDSEGHPFRGNQWTNGGGGDPTKDTIKSHQDQANHHDEMAANAKSDEERTAHEQAAQSHRDAAMSWRMTGSNEEGGEGAQVASDDAWADSENANAKSAVTKGDTPGHPFHGNQFTAGQGGEKDTADKIMDAVNKYGNENPNAQMNKGWQTVMEQAKMIGEHKMAIPKELVDAATKEDMDKLTDNNYHSARTAIEHQRPELADKPRTKEVDLSNYFKAESPIDPLTKGNEPNYGKLISSRKSEPTDKDLYSSVKSEAKKKFDVYPSAVANGWVVQEYKRRGGTYHKPVTKGDVAGHAFHGNQYQSGNVSTAYGTSYKSNGTNIIPSNVGGRDFDLKTTVDQIGRMNILAISGGKVNSVADAKGNQVGLELPVSNGYSVRVLLANDDTYTVQRCFTRGSNESVKGEQTGVYADEVGETAYQAGMFRSNNFGDHIVTKASDELISEWIEPFVKAKQGPEEVSASANEVVGVRIDDFPTEAPALEEQLVLEIPVEEVPQEIEVSDDVEKSADVEEWTIPVYKGGQGSGEQAGHPFRGNRWTAGTGSSAHHDDRGDKGKNYGYHLDAAASHIIAGRAAQSQGDHGAAMRHFNEAAYHASQASAKLQKPGGFTNRTLGGSAETLYHLAHDAGNASEKANFANREVTRYTRDGGNDPAELASRQQAASSATEAANRMGSTLESHAATVDSVRSQVGDPTHTSAPAPVSAPAREAQAG